MDADILIVGAGIAGLRCGIRLLQQRPHAKVIILEKYKYIGGRVVTYKHTLEEGPRGCRKVQWENGAGRVFADHKKVHGLIKAYGLTAVPLGKDSLFITEDGVVQDNAFDKWLKILMPMLQTLSADVLATHTLGQILEKLLGSTKAHEILIQFPYRAEVTTLRADLALHSFAKEMGTYQGYSHVKEGLGAIIEHMVKDFEKRGGQILGRHTVVDVHQNGDTVVVKSKTDEGPKEWKAPTVILALHSEALAKLTAFQGWGVLKHLRMEPLFRIYAVFPVKDGKSWFSDMPRFVTDSPVRYFIPWNPACGSAMMSYTDAVDARRLMRILDKHGEKSLQQFLLKSLRRMFPDRTIPDPIFFKTHPWTFGCTYWLPGHYDPAELSEKALHPFPRQMPGVFACGESFSLRQAWMEGALEHADLLMKTYF